MASINGVTLKALKVYNGMEGPTYYGNLYIGSKKVAEWAQDPNGAITDNIHMVAGFSEQKLRNLFKEYDKCDYDIGFERAMSKLVCLTNEEKCFKKNVKSGYPFTFVLSDGFHADFFGLPESYNKKTVEELKEELFEPENFFKNPKMEFHLYKSLEDFKIGTPVKLEDLKR